MANETALGSFQAEKVANRKVRQVKADSHRPGAQKEMATLPTQSGQTLTFDGSEDLFRVPSSERICFEIECSVSERSFIGRSPHTMLLKLDCNYH